MESLYLLFFAFFILVIVLPLTFDGKISYDAIENRGALSIRLWPLKFKVARLKRKGKEILLITKRKNSDVNVEVGEKQLRFITFFKDEVSNKLKIRKVSIYSNLGAGDPFKSAIFSSAVSNGILVGLSRLKMWQPTASFSLKNKTDFYDNKLALALNARFALSLFDVLYSFLISVLRNKQDRIIEEKLKNL